MKKDMTSVKFLLMGIPGIVYIHGEMRVKHPARRCVIKYQYPWFVLLLVIAALALALLLQLNFL